MRKLVLLLPALAGMGCEEKKAGITIGGTGAKADCALSLDGLVDTQWSMLRAMPDKSEVADPKTRLKFVTEDGGLKVKYNVGSLSDVYTYTCTKNAAGDELTCREKARPRDWCQAFLTGGGECTAEGIKKLDPNLGDEEIAKAIEEATANVNKYKNTPDWKQFVFNNNNLGNKLQGILYVKVDTRGCRLRIIDNYMTIYNGKRIEDSNPVGTNPFVKHEGGELLWEHCTDGKDIAAMPQAELPADLSKLESMRQAGLGDTVYFQYLGTDGRTPVDGCEYSYDLWFDGMNPQRGLKPTVGTIEGKPGLVYAWSHKWTEPNKDGTQLAGTTTLHRKWTCADASKSGEEVSCAALVIK